MKPHNTLLKKVILLFLSIFIPLTLLSVITLHFSNQKLKRQVLSSIDNNNAHYMFQLDTTLNNIYIMNFNLINQSNVRMFSSKFPTLSDYEKGVQVKMLREQMSNVRVMSPLINSVHIYFKELGLSYNSYKATQGSFHPISETELKLLLKTGQEQKALFYYPDSLTNDWTLSLYISSGLDARILSNIVLSQSELQNYLAANSSYENEHFLFTSDASFTLTDTECPSRKEFLDLQEELNLTSTDDSCQTVWFDGRKYYAFSYELPSISARYTRLIPTSSLLKHINTAPFLIMVFFVIIIAACILFFIGIYYMVHQPLQQFTNAFDEVAEGNFKVTIPDNSNSDFAYLYQGFNDMTVKLDRLIERDYNQKMLLQKAELKQLQAQINPHFLYNSFFMLQRLIKMEMMDDSQQMANALGLYFRYLTRNSRDLVTLAEEYEHAKTYAYIQGLRFAKRIQINFEELPKQFEKLPVPKLILQPLLENAFNYGLHNKIADGLLNIHFDASDDTLTIIVEDNGEELTDEFLQTLSSKLENVKTDSISNEMTGILNIERRLIIFSNCSDSLQVSRSQLGGLCVSITLKNNTEVF